MTNRFLGSPLLTLAVLVLATNARAGDRNFRRTIAVARDCIEAKDYETVVKVVQVLLDVKGEQFVELKDAHCKVEKISVYAEGERLLKTMPSEGREEYEKDYGGAAKKLLDAAGKDEAKLAELARRFLFTKAGAQGGERLALMHFDAGKAKDAAKLFARLADAQPLDKLTPPTLFKAARAFHLAGDTAQRDRYFNELYRQAPKGFRLGTRELTIREAELAIKK